MYPLSSLFDIATLATPILGFGAGPEAIRTVCFLESMATQILVSFIPRSGVALAAALALPFTPIGALIGFASPPTGLLAAVALVSAADLLGAERVKPLTLRPPAQRARR